MRKVVRVDLLDEHKICIKLNRLLRSDELVVSGKQSQFHQHYTCAFFVRKFVQSQNVSSKSCQNDVRTINSYVKTLMKLTPVMGCRCRAFI